MGIEEGEEMKLEELVETVEYPSADEVVQYLNTDYQIVDRDMGNVYIVKDPKTDRMFDVRAGVPLEVHSHEDSPEGHRAADELYRDLIRNAKSYFNPDVRESKEWDVESTGEWDGMSVAEIEKVANRLRAKEDRTEEDSRRLKAANFAIRAKKAGGKKWKGVKAK